MGKAFRKLHQAEVNIGVVPTFSDGLRLVCGLCLASGVARTKRAKMEARSGTEMPQQLTSAAELLALAGDLWQAGSAVLVCLPPEW